MKIKKKISLLMSTLLVMMSGNGLAIAEDGLDSSQFYTRTFTTSAYYSPLPCQDRYVTGSFAGDKRLNGNGTNGADGTPVYPGMVAAPGGADGYQFGTKMQIPGIGIVGVHDRGGAIVRGDDNTGRHDRLDIWMGYGDIGLNRALNWGKRDLDITVYGVDDSIAEAIVLGDYSPNEAIPAQCDMEQWEAPVVTVASTASVKAVFEEVTESDYFTQTLSMGASGDQVEKLQSELKTLNFYRGESTGSYDDATLHAVFKFQQSQGIVSRKDDTGAGVLGPLTRERVNELIATRKYNDVLIAEATMAYTNTLLATDNLPIQNVQIASGASIALEQELQLGAVDNDVLELQKFLAGQGYFDAELVTNHYGEMTRTAVMKFQLANGIIQSASDIGAGRVGPATLEFINSLS